MAQSYDVYFARMILTLELVEREAIQAALHAYQQAGGGIGFPKWLVDHQLLDKAKVKKVSDELEKWFKAVRSREGVVSPSEEERAPVGIARDEDDQDADEDVEDAYDEDEDEDQGAPDESSATQAKKAAKVFLEPDSSNELEVPPDEESSAKAAAPVKAKTSGQSSSRPNLVIPADRTPTPKAQPRPPGKGSTPPLASPRPAAVTPPAALPRTTAPVPPPMPAAPAPSSKGALPRESARLRKPEAEKSPEKAPAEKPERVAEKTAEKAAEKPRSTSGRVKSPSSTSGRVKSASTSGRVKPPSADKQWALFEKATKDPLARLVGQRLGRTEILKLINTAEIVTNFEGRHGDDERGALVKVLRPDKVKDKVALERFSREAQSLAKIDHPNISRILESGTAEGVRYMSMEIGSGEPLSKVLERSGRLPPERVVKLARGIALGLAAAHRAGIVHRDLRPANILVEEGSVRLMGFGIARDVSVPGRLTATGHITGHPSYVAPEVAQAAEVTTKVDIYSLGIVLYLALSGRLPFESRSVVKLVGLHLNAAPPKLTDVATGCPPRLAAVVERCLAKDPAARPEAMDIANALAAKDILEGFDADKWKEEANKVDTEELLRRALATDEHPSVDASAEKKLGGPACAACELPIGASVKSVSLHGNQICAKCVERVEALELCAACLLEIDEKDAGTNEVAVFAGHIYCRSCTRRVRLPCAACKKEAPLAGLASGQTKAKGDQLIHVTCPR